VLLRPPTCYYDPLFERPDLTEDDYYPLRHPSRLTAAKPNAVTAPNPDKHGYPGPHGSAYEPAGGDSEAVGCISPAPVR
jgi:hypothetical protein